LQFKKAFKKLIMPEGIINIKQARLNTKIIILEEGQGIMNDEGGGK